MTNSYLEIGELVLARPKIGQFLQMANVLNLFQTIEIKVQNLQVQIVVKSADVLNTVLCQVEFFETEKLIKTLKNKVFPLFRPPTDNSYPKTLLSPNKNIYQKPTCISMIALAGRLKTKSCCK